VSAAAAAFALAAALASTSASAADWRRIDPENLLVVDTTKGRMLVEMRPDLAPKAVERIRLLTRERVYDGLQFHRVVAGFVAQTGNPNNKDGGVSRHPDLAPEFTFTLRAGAGSGGSPPFRTVTRRSDGFDGLAGSTPIAGETRPATGFAGATHRGWGAYCTGVAGMGRQADPGTANSELFFMLAPERRLDHEYTVWGTVVVGRDVLTALAIGEPPARPDLMTRVRVAADLPAPDQPTVQLEDGPALQRRIDAARRSKGADFSICDVEVAARVVK
jgi:peptidylprolyl isomerase